MTPQLSLQARFRLSLRRLGIQLDRWPARLTLEDTLDTIIRRYKVDSVVDVGANVGRWAKTVRLTGYDGPLLSIEPVSTAYEALEQSAEGDPTWSTARYAVGAEHGTAAINVAESNTTSSLLEPRDEYVGLYSRARTVDRETVEMVRLDSLDIPGERVVLKTDTQGFDMQVLDGATGLMDRIVAVQCELSVRELYEGMRNDWRSVVDRLEGDGFALSGMFPISHDDQHRLLEMDGVFVRANPDAS